MSRSFTIALLFPLSLIGACSSLPKDAPNEFVDAKSSLEAMDNQKVKRKLPNTADRAHSTFKEAVADLKQARKDDVSDASAIQKARTSKEIADNAIEMDNRVKSWDDDQDQLNAALRSMRSGNVAAEDDATLSPFAKLRDKDIVNTVAYFDTNDYSSPIVNQKQLESITSVLKADKSFHVVLTGHADTRGEASYNEELAMKRAKTIAATLQENGITEDQIVFRSAGSAEATAPSGSTERMQLDRNVQAVVSLR